jgi:hypothetical protein
MISVRRTAAVGARSTQVPSKTIPTLPALNPPTVLAGVPALVDSAGLVNQEVAPEIPVPETWLSRRHPDRWRNQQESAATR